MCTQIYVLSGERVYRFHHISKGTGKPKEVISLIDDQRQNIVLKSEFP